MARLPHRFKETTYSFQVDSFLSYEIEIAFIGCECTFYSVYCLFIENLGI